MSIYDDQFSEDPQQPAQPPPDKAPADQLAGEPSAVEAGFADGDDQDAKPQRRTGCGCRSCFLVFLAFFLISIAFCGIGGYLVVKRAPDWAHDAIVAAVNDSELDAREKREIAKQMDRLLKEYKAGNVSQERIARALEEVGKSPVLVLIMAYAAKENFIAPSGLTEDEKADAKLAFQRVARGTFNKKISPDDLEKALDYITTKDFNGNRQLKTRVPDSDLRELVKECNRVADEAGIPNEPYQVDVAAEVKRIVDRALGIMPDEEPAAENGDSPPAPEATDAQDGSAAAASTAGQAAAP